MKKLLALLALCIASTAFAGGEAKQVCTDVMDKAGKPVLNKDKTVKQSCKTIKTHKKVEGDKVPDGKK